METLTFLLAILVIAALVFAIAGITIVREYESCVVFKLGRLMPLRGPGLVFVTPLIERRQIVDLRTVTFDVPTQDAMTRDSVTVKVDAVLYFRVIDPVKAVTSVVDYEEGIDLASLTTLRNVIGQHDLDDLLKSRDRVGEMLRDAIDATTAPWGVRVQKVDIKGIDIPEDMQRAMSKVVEAEREKRARLIKAEAEAEAAQKLTEASRLIADSPMALELRRMQMISEVGAENNTTTIFLMPSEFVTAAKHVERFLAKASGPPPT